MAAKKPLANYAGTLKELQTGDTVTGLGGTLVAYKADGTQDNIDLLDGGGITVLPIAQGGTGAATGPAALISLGAREVLTAARTYYVATTGSDSNNGLAVGTPFLTIQKAVDVVCALDTGIYNVTIQVADGTYTGAVVFKMMVGGGELTIQGNAGTPNNVVISVTNNHCFNRSVPGPAITIKDLKMSTTTGGSCLISFVGTINISNVVFGSCAAHHKYALMDGTITATGNYSVSGGALSHDNASRGGRVDTPGKTVTLSGTPAFTTAYAVAGACGCITCYSCTFSGSATGLRYSSSLNGVINTLGSGATYFPGDVAGTTATGGQYA